MFHMSNDSNVFLPRRVLENRGAQLEGSTFRGGPTGYLPLYEGKLFHLFDHRWATYDGDSTRDVRLSEKQDPFFSVEPRYWVAEDVFEHHATDLAFDWLLAWRDITGTVNERTLVAAAIPVSAVGHNAPVILIDSPEAAICLLACLSSFAVDYVSRVKVGGNHMTYFILDQLPVPPPSYFDEPAPWAPTTSKGGWLRSRMLELVYTARDMTPFARSLGYEGDPFEWDPDRRAQLKAEIDAAIFFIYGYGPTEVEFVLDSFAVVRRKDNAVSGEYRTKRLIQQEYDRISAMARLVPSIAES
jgi:hypothetical protein